MTVSRLLAIVAFTVAVVSLARQARQALVLGTRRVDAPARGSAWRGVLYAFGPGMSPWAKESARAHPMVYAAGLAYHVGVFAALGLAAGAAAGAAWPARLGPVLALIFSLALAAGLGLLARRIRVRVVRAISSPDDYASNLFVDALVTSALLSTLAGAYMPSLLLTASAVLLYAPLGKIRHCVFFFLARAGFGRLLGRRGVLPRAAGGGAS